MNSTPAAALFTMAAALTCGTAHAAAVRTGTFKVVSTIVLSANVPATAVLSASASAYFYDPVGGSHQVLGSATVKRSGNKGTVTLMLPYRWAVGQTTGTVTLALSVGASTTAAPFAEVSTAVPLPADGAATQVVLRAAL